MALRCSDKYVAAMASWAIMLMALLGAKLATAIDDCPWADTRLVYPYWSMCWNPAVYFGEEVYELEAIQTGGRLAPEWDESNSTYYIRAAEVGAKYKLTYWRSREGRPAVRRYEDLGFVNVESGRGLTWRREGENEWFLVEEASPATFQFAAAPDVSLACPLIEGARCEAYHILNYYYGPVDQSTTFGLSAYEEDGVTYFTRASEGSKGLPFLLRRSRISSTTSTSALRMPGA